MSERIRKAVAMKEICLQSPIDDLESFYNVFVWAILHNEHSQNALSRHEQIYKDELSGPIQSRRDAQTNLQRKVPTAAIVSQLQDVIADWGKIQAELQQKHDVIVSRYPQLVANKFIGQGSNAEQVFWKWIWNLDRKSTRLNSSHSGESRMPSSA